MSTLDYSILVEPLSKEEGGGYMATVPDLPGCMSDGETDLEALKNAQDAIAVWIARARAMGRPIPRPATVQHRRPSDRTWA